MNITNDIITAYLDSLYRSENEDLGRLREYGEDNMYHIILKDTEDLLRVITKIYEPKRILEIGTAIGYSAIFFASICDTFVTTIEANADKCVAAESNIRQFGFEEEIQVIHGDGLHVLQKLQEEMQALDEDEREGRKYDLVFIDAAKSHYLEFWEAALPLVKKHSLIICDNVLMRGTTASEIYDPKNKHRTSIRHMREFLSYIKHLDYAETTILPVGDGVSISLLTLHE